jgi:dipeptidyl-peptidase-3
MSIIKEDEVTHKLEAKKVFNKLKEDETEDGATYRAYTHHLSRACWHGARVIFRQTSPESEGLFEYILELHRACDGHWEKLLDTGLTLKHLRAWLEFAGMFLSSLGNHYVGVKLG